MDSSCLARRSRRRHHGIRGQPWCEMTHAATRVTCRYHLRRRAAYFAATRIAAGRFACSERLVASKRHKQLHVVPCSGMGPSRSNARGARFALHMNTHVTRMLRSDVYAVIAVNARRVRDLEPWCRACVGVRRSVLGRIRPYRSMRYGALRPQRLCHFSAGSTEVCVGPYRVGRFIDYTFYRKHVLTTDQAAAARSRTCFGLGAPDRGSLSARARVALVRAAGGWSLSPHLGASCKLSA